MIDLSKIIEIGSQRTTSTSMFNVVLFAIFKVWKQPEYPSTNKHIKKMCYMYTMEY